MLGGEPDEAVISEAVGDAHRVFTAIEKLADADSFLIDEEVTLADLYLAPVYDYVTQIPEGEQILAGCDKLAGWWSRMKDRACTKSTRPQLG
jgi:glutathione S-transferase